MRFVASRCALDRTTHLLRGFRGRPVGSGILESAWPAVLGGKITNAYTRLCWATKKPVWPERMWRSGELQESMLAGERPFTDEWEYFAGLRERGPLAAHYAGVENGLLKSVWPYPRNSPDFARSGESIIEWGPWIDSARLYAQFYPQFDSGRLETLVAATGLQTELDTLAKEHCPLGRHRYHAALYDALAGALLLASLARDPRLAELTVMQLLALSTLGMVTSAMHSTAAGTVLGDVQESDFLPRKPRMPRPILKRILSRLRIPSL